MSPVELTQIQTVLGYTAHERMLYKLFKPPSATSWNTLRDSEVFSHNGHPVLFQLVGLFAGGDWFDAVNASRPSERILRVKLVNSEDRKALSAAAKRADDHACEEYILSKKSLYPRIALTFFRRAGLSDLGLIQFSCTARLHALHRPFPVFSRTDIQNISTL